MSNLLFSGFSRKGVMGSEDLSSGTVGLEVKSGRMKGSHAVINESQIKDVQGKYG